MLMDAYFRGEMAKIRYKVAFLQRITLMEKKREIYQVANRQIFGYRKYFVPN